MIHTNSMINTKSNRDVVLERVVYDNLRGVMLTALAYKFPHMASRIDRGQLSAILNWFSKYWVQNLHAMNIHYIDT